MPRPRRPPPERRWGDPRLAGFGQTRHVVGEADYYNATGGEGPPVLLLHGFPQTHFCWRAIAPRLARHHAVVAPDLRGYGASRAPAGGPHGEGFSKREMAGDLVEVMSALAHERFAVVGHDRGARVAYRMALDHPERVARVAVLNVVPTIEQFERMGAAPSLGFWPWFLLAQPAPFPEQLLEAAPAVVLDHVFSRCCHEDQRRGSPWWTSRRATDVPHATAATRRTRSRSSRHAVPGPSCRLQER
jgi:haloacetate dehalogenase